MYGLIRQCQCFGRAFHLEEPAAIPHDEISWTGSDTVFLYFTSMTGCVDGADFWVRWLHIGGGVLTSKKIYCGQDSEVGFHFEEGVWQCFQQAEQPDGLLETPFPHRIRITPP